jgi:histone-lysine N-methyltransferase SETMAR
MEALIPAPADCEVRSVIKFLNALQKLRRAIQNKRHRMLSAGIVFLHDNARPHTARRTASLLQEFSWDVFNHPLYSPDLAPSDFHLFLHLKKFLLTGTIFISKEDKHLLRYLHAKIDYMLSSNTVIVHKHVKKHQIIK